MKKDYTCYKQAGFYENDDPLLVDHRFYNQGCNNVICLQHFSNMYYYVCFFSANMANYSCGMLFFDRKYYLRDLFQTLQR